MNMSETLDLNNPQVRLISGNTCKKPEQIYLQSLVERIARIYETVIVTKGSDVDESKV